MPPTFHVAAVVIRDAAESAAGAAVREIGEELGIELDPHALVDLGTFTADAANEPGHLVVGRVFEHPWVPGARASAEIAEVSWLEPGSAAARDDLAPLLRDHVLPLLADGCPQPRAGGIGAHDAASLGA